jgi:branched-chain amino acid transport system ATP-binding protein
MSLLEVTDLSVRYGAADALRNVSLHVEEGEVVTIIGSNGAGKTTTLRAITGMHVANMASTGSVTFDGHSILGKSSHTITNRGLVHVPEGRHVFPAISVEDNLLLGAYRLRRVLKADKRMERVEEIYELFPVLKQRREQYAGFLSGGEQQMLAIGRALMADPRLLVLDEPSLGLAPRLVQEMFEIVQTLAGAGKTILLVEQMARQALGVADRAYVLSGGSLVREGVAHDLLNDSDVKKAYLGMAS